MRNHKTLTILTVAVFAFALPLPSSQASGATTAAQAVNTYAIVHFAETKGRITDSQNSFDTTVYAYYAGGPGINLDIYLFDKATGLPFPAGPRGKCDPCRFTFGGASNRLQTIHFQDYIDFSTRGVALGFAVFQFSGDDPARLPMDIYLSNSHTSAFDLSYALLPLHPLPGWRR